METIHIDRYDDASQNDSQTGPASKERGTSGRVEQGEQAQPWYARFLPGDMSMPASLGDATQRVATFVKEKPAAAAVAALGIGLFLSGGLRKNKLLKAAFGAFGVPYLQRSIASR